MFIHKNLWNILEAIARGETPVVGFSNLKKYVYGDTEDNN